MILELWTARRRDVGVALGKHCGAEEDCVLDSHCDARGGGV